MILRNYHNTLAAYVLGATYTGDPVFGDGYLTVKHADGSVYNLDMSSKSRAYTGKSFSIGRSESTIAGSYSTNSGYPRIIFGTGNSAVTYDDFKLESEYSNISKASFVVTEPVYNASTKKYTNTVSFVLTNTGTEDVTIREVGVNMEVIVKPGAYPSEKDVLVYREVIDEPVTIAANASMKYKHTFEFAMPSIG